MLHALDISIGFSAPALTVSQDISDPRKLLGPTYINIYGLPNTVSSDVEFLNKYSSELKYFIIKFGVIPARQHNKREFLRSRNSVLGILSQRFISSKEHAQTVPTIDVSAENISTRFSYLSKFFFGTKLLSSIDIASAFAPATFQLPQTVFSYKLITVHHEQILTREIEFLYLPNVLNLLNRNKFANSEKFVFQIVVQVLWVAPNLRSKTAGAHVLIYELWIRKID